MLMEDLIDLIVMPVQRIVCTYYTYIGTLITRRIDFSTIYYNYCILFFFSSIPNAHSKYFQNK